MARLPALIAALTLVDGRDLATISLIARFVREAGFIPTTARGWGSSTMTEREAANLVLGANGAEAPKAAAEAVSLFRTLAPQLPRTSSDPMRNGVLGRLDRAAGFGEAIEALIVCAPEIQGLFLDYVRAAYPEVAKNDDSGRAWSRMAEPSFGSVGLDIEFSRPTPSGRIVFWHAVEHGRVLDHEWTFRPRSDLVMQGFYPEASGRRRVTVSIDFATILALHSALQEG